MQEIIASISRAANGTRRIQFKGLDGKRKTLRMGTTVNKHKVESIRRRVERILEARITATGIDPETAQWIADAMPFVYRAPRA